MIYRNVMVIMSGVDEEEEGEGDWEGGGGVELVGCCEYFFFRVCFEFLSRIMWECCGVCWGSWGRGWGRGLLIICLRMFEFELEDVGDFELFVEVLVWIFEIFFNIRVL